MIRMGRDISRRQFLAGAGAMGSAMWMGVERLSAEEADPRVAQIVARTIAVDMHNHVNVPYARTAADAKPVPAIDLAGQIKRSGFSAICETYNIDGLAEPQTGDYSKYFLQGLDFEDQLLKRNHMHRALTLQDLEAAHQAGQPIIAQSTEGAQFIEGHLDRIEEAYKRGLRHLQLVHERDDMVAPLGDVYTAPAHLGGLTDAGAEVIRECNRLGILVDMAHGTDATVRGALKVATQPFIISHTGLARETDNADMRRRLIDRELARAVAGAGGVIGVWWRLSDTLGDYVRGVKAMVDAVGIDHAGIGTDTNLTSSNMLPYTNQIWPDQNGGFFYAVAGEMLKQGFTPEEIGKFGGGNFCRVFGKATAARS